MEDYFAWALPLMEMRSSPYDECLVNIVTFVEHFGITREVFQQVINNYRLDTSAFVHFNLDVIYSGNWALIEEYYSIENEELHFQLMNERRDAYYSVRLMELQQVVNDNVNDFSIYFHDIWTYASFTPPGGKASTSRWMQRLVHDGEYERVNLIEFLNHTRLTRESFERWMNEDNMRLFTHYNLDIIFSGDEQLMRQYYSAENQPIHTAQVQAAFNQHVATYGWDRNVTPPAITTTSLYRGNLDQPYSQTLQAASQQPVVWTIVSGSLPPGLTLASTGAISGTPTTDGEYNFIVRAANLGGYVTQELSIVVLYADVPISLPILTTGHGYTLVVMSDGSLWSWGRNVWAQLGDGTFIERHLPVQAMYGIAAASAGANHAVAIRSNGSLWAWGNNEFGQLGSGAAMNRYSPTPIWIMDDVVAVSSGITHTMAIRSDGSLWGWGSNQVAQLGDGTTVCRQNPVWIMDDVVAVSAGLTNTMAIRSDGSLWSWGRNQSGQVGDGTRIDRHSPVWIMDDVVAVSASTGFALAIRSDGSLWGWGENNLGQLGSLTYWRQPNPIWILDDVVEVSAGRLHATAIRSDGSLWGWGHNGFAQLGDGTTTDHFSPVWIMDDVVAVSGGDAHTVVIRNDGAFWAWGGNLRGQVGDGTTITRYRPVPINVGEMSPSAFGFMEQAQIGTDADIVQPNIPNVTINWDDGQEGPVKVVIIRPDRTESTYTHGPIHVPIGSDVSFYVIPEYYNADGHTQFSVDFTNTSPGLFVIPIVNQPALDQTPLLVAREFSALLDIDISFVITY